MLRRHHYERAFEEFLRSHRTPYVAVDEARKALLPKHNGTAGTAAPAALKSFDFVIYAEGGPNLLVDIKGRKVVRRPGSPPVAAGRLESWVTEDDIDSLRHWETLFGPQFRAAFVFVYWCDQQPPDALFQEVFEHDGRWYVLRAVRLDDYARAMKPRSQRWRTVHVPAAAFERISHPLGRLSAPPAPVAAPVSPGPPSASLTVRAPAATRIESLPAPPFAVGSAT